MLLPPGQAESDALREGLLLAAEQANASTNTHARVIVRGQMGQWGADAVEAARMVTDDGAMGLIAPPDGAATHLALQIAGRTAVPVVSLCPDSSITKTGVPWMVCVVPRTIEQVRTLFTGLKPKLANSQRRCVALVPAGRPGREAAHDLTDASKQTDFALLKTFEVNPTNGITESVKTDILRRQPDLILVWLHPVSAGVIVKELRATGFKGILAGPAHLLSVEFMNSAGSASEGFIIPTVVLDQNSQATFSAFNTAFRNRFGHEPGATAAFSFDAGNLLLYILQTSEGEPRRSFPLAFSVTGASGKLSFDRYGNRKGELRLLVAHQGKFVPADKHD
jgi:branched-chain amino acid transport system substrate-binding protein